MTKQTRKFNFSIFEFLAIQSIDKAIMIRGLELILLTIIVSVSYFSFSSLGILIPLIVGIFTTTFISYYFHKRSGRKKEEAQ